jgi:hypothetical protein
MEPDDQRSTFNEFCEETNLNGWYYMAKRNLSKVSRLFWASVILGSICLATWFNWVAFVQFLGANVIITVDSVSTSLDHVHFPAIIICNQNQVSSSSSKATEVSVRLFQVRKSFINKWV